MDGEPDISEHKDLCYDGLEAKTARPSVSCSTSLSPTYFAESIAIAALRAGSSLADRRSTPRRQTQKTEKRHSTFDRHVREGPIQ